MRVAGPLFVLVASESAVLARFLHGIKIARYAKDLTVLN